MNSDMKSEPRVRILQAAAELFARRGYGLVGVREIAGLAEVNVAMISYYFEGKIGILHTIIDTFFDLYFKLVEKEYDPEMTPEESIRHLVA
ncbi:MAG: TetR/AcrR family transcriptional regulator, partial [Calditrichaeota bacterium]